MLTRRRERDAAGPRRERGSQRNGQAPGHMCQRRQQQERPRARAPVDWIGPPAAEGPLHTVVCISVLCSKPSYSGDSQGSVDHIQISISIQERSIPSLLIQHAPPAFTRTPRSFTTILRPSIGLPRLVDALCRHPSSSTHTIATAVTAACARQMLGGPRICNGAAACKASQAEFGCRRRGR